MKQKAVRTKMSSSGGLYNLWGSIGVVILRQIKQCGKNRKQDK